jgi:hypothetical protein
MIQVRSYLLCFFLQVHSVAGPFTSHLKLYNYAEPKPFSGAKPASFDFSLSNFSTVRYHILSNGGDAVRNK